MKRTTARRERYELDGSLTGLRTRTEVSNGTAAQVSGCAAVDMIASRLGRYLDYGSSDSFNYVRYFLDSQASHLDAFVEGKPFPPFEVEVQMSSRCFFRCPWCIGAEIQSKCGVVRLANQITDDNIDKLVNGIIACRINGLGIQRVKFSGFIGEPLVTKAATLKAIRQLNGAGLSVGLFTNGFLMDKDTWDTLATIDYVHISLDGGPITHSLLKGSPQTPCCRSFETVVENIAGLAETRHRRAGKAQVRINVGFVLVPGNVPEIYEATRIVREAGADLIRFKCDIGEKYSLRKSGRLDLAFSEIERACQSFHAPPAFEVHTIHTQQDVEDRSYAQWDCSKGCFFQEFLATVGSDGNLYLCDHNTMPSGTPMGNVINDSFEKVWQSESRGYLKVGARYICRSPVCPPYANRVNFFLRAIQVLTRRHGPQLVKQALAKLSSGNDSRHDLSQPEKAAGACKWQNVAGSSESPVLKPDHP